MHRRIALSALTVLALAAVPAVGSAQTVTFRVTGPQAAPPAPRVVQHVAAPAPGIVWVPGSWAWQANQWVWNEGYWEQSRPGYVMVQPQWVQSGGRWVYQAGGWAPAGTRRVAYGFERSRRWQPNPHRAVARQIRADRRAIRAQQRAIRRDHRAMRRQMRQDRRAFRYDARQDRRASRFDDRRGVRVQARPVGPRVQVRRR